MLWLWITTLPLRVEVEVCFAGGVLVAVRLLNGGESRG